MLTTNDVGARRLKPRAAMMHFAPELAAADVRMRNEIVGEDVYTRLVSASSGPWG